MVKGKKLVSLISTEGKTPEQICKEATEAYKKFNTALTKAKNEFKKKETDNK